MLMHYVYLSCIIIQNLFKQVEMIKMVHQILDLIPNDEFASEILKASKNLKNPSREKSSKASYC